MIRQSYNAHHLCLIHESKDVIQTYVSPMDILQSYAMGLKVDRSIFFFNFFEKEKTVPSNRFFSFTKNICIMSQNLLNTRLFTSISVYLNLI